VGGWVGVWVGREIDLVLGCICFISIDFNNNIHMSVISVCNEIRGLLSLHCQTVGMCLGLPLFGMRGYVKF
jgi:hypothetical protein